ncbi:hypothetical protein DFA_09569 [Cavenderia fasciculata]|uniref:non-specific serine/threonine protein kinase n=1 Tax=Cavenderia fasciculata TaxID=261658 RepID=F4Q800_CACFS|nr:uncharacterized protein DFA_09569 [Cavenderia fasciculata]EGG15900.1 hypothetical protein DFA_09569 [Cavenderia fasciculata]|eukprot:XP_004352225.1 hypothetical protein DFA_09569 [Cavenderia fasciculata]
MSDQIIENLEFSGFKVINFQQLLPSVSDAHLQDTNNNPSSSTTTTTSSIHEQTLTITMHAAVDQPLCVTDALLQLSVSTNNTSNEAETDHYINELMTGVVREQDQEEQQQQQEESPDAINILKQSDHDPYFNNVLLLQTNNVHPLPQQQYPTISKFETDYHSFKIGSGGQGTVYQATYIVDDGIYAIKKCDKSNIESMQDECRIMARLNDNPHIIKYFYSWIETIYNPSSTTTTTIINNNNYNNNINMHSNNNMYNNMYSNRSSPSSPSSTYSSSSTISVVSNNNSNNNNNDTSLTSQRYASIGYAPTLPQTSTIDQNMYINNNMNQVLYIQMELAKKTLRSWMNKHVATQALLKIGDFGLTTTIDECQTKQNKQGLGTNLYASPEQMRGGQYDETTDVYSVAIIYYELISNWESSQDRYQRLTNPNIYNDITIRHSHPLEVALIAPLLERENRPKAYQILQYDFFKNNNYKPNS